MDLEQRLRASLAAPDPGALFTARVMARVGVRAGRWRSRFILMGTVLVVGAAAAMLTWRLFDVQPLPVESAAIPAVSDSGSGAEEPGQAMPEVSELMAATSELATPEVISPRYSVLVMPLREEAQDVSRRGHVDAFHTAMLDELRKVPGLMLRLPGDRERGAGGQADYVLTIASLATAAAQSGGVTFRSTDGGNAYTVTGGSRDLDHGTSGAGDGGVAAATYGAGAMTGAVSLVLNNRLAGVDIDYGVKEAIDGGGANFFSSGRGSMSSVSASGGVISFDAGDFSRPESVLWMEMRVEPRQSAASRYTFPVGVDGKAEQRRCNAPDGDLPPECMTPAQLAATQVAMLRLQVFPPDAGFQQRVMARLGDASLDGQKVLQDLLPLLTGDGGSRLEAGTIRALFRYAAGQPAETRTRVWRTLSRVSHPALAAPLVESLLHDADRQVRLAALANLEANYSTDPVVRSAFEAVERGDPDVMVRAAVRWALYGQARWRDDVLAALHDTALSYEARLAPLIARTSADFSPQQAVQMSLVRRAVLQEQQVLRQLIPLVRAHLRDNDHAQVTGNALGLLGNVDDPAVFDLFLQLMRETSLPIQLSGPVGSWALNHRNDPRVRESLPLVETAIPLNLLERMREVTEQGVPPAPLAE